MHCDGPLTRQEGVCHVHIVALTNEYEPQIIGGLGIVATRVAQRLAARGHEMTVVTRGRGPTVEDRTAQGVRVLRFPVDSVYYSAVAGGYATETVAQYLHETIATPDIVHVHSIHADRLAHRLHLRYGCPYIYTCHSLIAAERSARPAARRLEARQRRLMREASAVVSPSQWQARIVERLVRGARSRSHVIPNGADGHSLTSMRHNQRFLYAGRVVRGKGVAELIQAVAIARRRGLQLQLDIRGDGGRSYMQRLRRLVAKHKLRQAVRVLGPAPHTELLRVMPQYNGVILPSRGESFGLVALEAMATGTPLLATRVGGLRDFVDEHAATVIDSAAPLAIANALQRVCRYPADVELRRRRAHIRAERYRWGRCATRYERLFTSLAETRALPRVSDVLRGASAHSGETI